MSNFDQMIADFIKFWDKSELKQVGTKEWFPSAEQVEQESITINNFIERLKSYQ